MASRATSPTGTTRSLSPLPRTRTVPWLLIHVRAVEAAALRDPDAGRVEQLQQARGRGGRWPSGSGARSRSCLDSSFGRKDGKRRGGRGLRTCRAGFCSITPRRREEAQAAPDARPAFARCCSSRARADAATRGTRARSRVSIAAGARVARATEEAPRTRAGPPHSRAPCAATPRAPRPGTRETRRSASSITPAAHADDRGHDLLLVAALLADARPRHLAAARVALGQERGRALRARLRSPAAPRGRTCSWGSSCTRRTSCRGACGARRAGPRIPAPDRRCRASPAWWSCTPDIPSRR